MNGRAIKFWDLLTKISVGGIFALGAFIWGHHEHLSDHETRIALIENSRFTGVNGLGMKASITEDLRGELDEINDELKTISERLARIEAKAGG